MEAVQVTPFAHLLPEVAEVAADSAQRRIDFIRHDRWIPYESANQILDRLQDIERLPRVNRMPCVFIAGHSDNGKSHILERFAVRYPAHANLGGENVLASVMLMETPTRPNDTELYRDILRRLNRYNSVNRDRSELRGEVVRILRDIELKMLILDEVTYALASTAAQRLSFFNGLRYLTNELRISIVCAGTEESIHLINSDQQIMSRFDVVALPRWKLDRSFRQLLANFEQVLPLRETSSLSAKELASIIHSRTDRTIGSISQLVNTAAIWSIQNGKERIDREAIEKCGYVPASERRRLVRDI